MTKQHISALDLAVDMLGPPLHDSPLIKSNSRFYGPDDRVCYFSETEKIMRCIERGETIPSFEAAGPRTKLFFQPATVRCGIVTCGGLCPGINDVIRAIVYEAYQRYGAQKVYGFRYGYRGMVQQNGIDPVEFDTDMVNEIHEKGGSVLGSSRGMQETGAMVDCLVHLGISVLFAIGGDGTLRGAAAIAGEISERRLPIAVIGIPKTIDNDICFVEQTFGFETAVEASREVIKSAHTESKGVENGVGLVKLMGRDSGFIAAQAAIANADVNFCLVPEVPFELAGEHGLLERVKKRLVRRRHAVIVVAEGAGQNLLAEHHRHERRRDASGNFLHEDIGVYLRNSMVDYFARHRFPATVKYIDPSYIIRSKPSNANDSRFCLQMGQCAVHAGMSGRTNTVIGFWNHSYTHVPIALAAAERKKIDPNSNLWQTVLSVLG
jgi:6-phosphofructokinase 1